MGPFLPAVAMQGEGMLPRPITGSQHMEAQPVPGVHLNQGCGWGEGITASMAGGFAAVVEALQALIFIIKLLFQIAIDRIGQGQLGVAMQEVAQTILGKQHHLFRLPSIELCRLALGPTQPSP
jgi:hypothetical protein